MEIKTFSPKNHKIKALIYWPSWSWKTSFWGTAEKVLFASAENWLLSIADKEVPYTEIKSLEDLEELRDFLKNQKHEFETLVIDSITEISDIIKMQIEKKAWRKMQIQDWWELSSKIEWIIKDIKDIDINVIVIAQELNITDEDKIQKIVPSLNWKSSTKICYYMDIVWYIYVDKSWKRTLITNSSDKLLTKDRTKKIWNNTELDFEVWKKLVNDMAIWEEKVLYKTMTAEELKQIKDKEKAEAKKIKENDEKNKEEEERKKFEEKQQNNFSKLFEIFTNIENKEEFEKQVKIFKWNITTDSTYISKANLEELTEIIKNIKVSFEENIDDKKEEEINISNNIQENEIKNHDDKKEEKSEDRTIEITIDLMKTAHTGAELEYRFIDYLRHAKKREISDEEVEKVKELKQKIYDEKFKKEDIEEKNKKIDKQIKEIDNLSNWEEITM